MRSFKAFIVETKKPKSGEHNPDYWGYRTDGDNDHLLSGAAKRIKNPRKRGNAISATLSQGHSFSDTEAKAVKNYTDNADVSDELNSSLHDGNRRVHRPHEGTKRGLDSAIKSNPLKHKLHLYSGVGSDPRKQMNKDGELRSSAYRSASHTRAVASIYSGAYDEHQRSAHIMHIHAEPGDPVMHTGALGHHTSGEHESIIARNTTLQHIRTEKHVGYLHGRHVYIHHFRIKKP